MHGRERRLIAMGARGGKGSSGMGSTLGALARGVIELEKGEQLYFMVGQPGMDACPKVRITYLLYSTNNIKASMFRR